MVKEGQIEIKLPNNVAFICALRAFIKSLAQRIGFQSPKIEDIELVVDELCNNAMEHGSDPNSLVWVIISIRDSALDILVRDEGRGESSHQFLKNLPRIRRKQTSPYSERGHGIYIVEMLSDYFCFSSNPMGGTDARVIFYKINSGISGER